MFEIKLQCNAVSAVIWYPGRILIVWCCSACFCDRPQVRLCDFRYRCPIFRKTNKILTVTVRTCLVIGAGMWQTTDCSAAALISIMQWGYLCQEYRGHKAAMVHSSACEIKWLLVIIFKLRLKKIEGCMQSWIILESSATAFLIWTPGEPVQWRWRTNTKQKVPQCWSAQDFGELSVVIAMAEERRYIKIIKVQVICALGD